VQDGKISLMDFLLKRCISLTDTLGRSRKRGKVQKCRSKVRWSIECSDEPRKIRLSGQWHLVVWITHCKN